MIDRLIDRIHYARDGRLVVLQKIKRSQKPLYIYGAGKAAQLRIKWLREYGIQIAGCCVDLEYYRPDMNVEGLTVYSIEGLNELDTEYELFIGFEDHQKAKQMACSLKKAGKTVYYIEDPFKFRYMDYDFFIKNSEKFQEAYDLLEDELSRDIFVAQLNARISACSDSMVQYQSPLPYGYDFELLNLSGHEAFVDCGAFDGDTVEELLQYTGGCCDQIYAFEPDAKNAQQMKEKFRAVNFRSEKITIIEKGLGKEKGMAGFFEDSSLYSNFVDSKMWRGGLEGETCMKM